MGKNLTRQIIESHLVKGIPEAGNPIELKIDNTLTQDATGTMTYLQLEAMGIRRVQTKRSVSYVDHNTLQNGYMNADDHKYLQGVADRYGVYYSRWETKDCGTLTGYGLRLGWNLFGPLGLEGRAGYLESKSETVETTLIPLEAALTWRFPLGQHLAPYIGGGVGYYMKDAEYNDTESWDDSEKSAGYFALAGLNLYLGAVSFFAEGKYNLVSLDDDLEWRGSDIESQNALDGLAWTAGIKLGF